MNQFRYVFGLSALLLTGILPGLHADTAVLADSATVAAVGPVVLTQKQMMDEIAPQLYQAEHQIYQIKRSWIDQKSKEILFTQAAAASGMSIQDWQKKEIDSKVPPVTQDEIDKTVLKYFAGQPAPSTTTVQQVTNYLASQKRTVRENEVFDQLKAKTPIVVNLPRPTAVRIDVSYAPDDPAKGPKNAPVTILEFTDYQCPYCKQSQATLQQVEEAYKGKLKIVTRQYPLPMHSRAKPAAEAAMCAWEQGKYWPFRDKLFASQTLSDEDFKQFAKDVKLNQKKFDACMAEHRYASRIDKDIADGQRFGVNGTPAFFVNGEFINGANPFSEFKEAVDNALAAPAPPAKTSKS